MIFTAKELIVNLTDIKSDFLYSTLQLLVPTIIALITIWIAQNRWKKDGYLKQKIELEIEIRKCFLITIEPFLIDLNATLKKDDKYSEEQLKEVQKKIYGLSSKLWKLKRDFFKKINEYKIFNEDKLINKLLSNYIEIASFNDHGGAMIEIEPNSFISAYFVDVNDEKITEYLSAIRQFCIDFFSLKKSIEKNFKKL